MKYPTSPLGEDPVFNFLENSHFLANLAASYYHFLFNYETISTLANCKSQIQLEVRLYN